jgi:hypothetical protein
MKYLIGFLAFWYDFLVGDDWMIAVGVILSLALSGVLIHARISAWPWLSLLIVCVLALSVRRAVKVSNPPP